MSLYTYSVSDPVKYLLRSSAHLYKMSTKANVRAHCAFQIELVTDLALS